MPRLDDLARSATAAGRMAPEAVDMGDDAALSAALGKAPEETDAGGDPEEALLSLEAALEGLSPDIAEQGKAHIEALRGILAESAPAAQESAPEGGEPPANAEPDLGSMMKGM